jgi:transcriptional regulator with XRE-family HTH domain
MKKGITLATVAEGASTSYQQIQKYESGRERISAGRLYQLSLTLAVPIRYFFEGLPKPHARSGPAGLRKRGHVSRRFP